MTGATAPSNSRPQRTRCVGRKAVFAAQFSLSHACFIITYPLAGILGATLGLAPTALILAAVAVLAGIVAARSWQTPASTKPEEALASPTPTGW